MPDDFAARVSHLGQRSKTPVCRRRSLRSYHRRRKSGKLYLLWPPG
jgi:hypothetical protein